MSEDPSEPVQSQSDGSDHSLVSLSSSESEHEDFVDAEEEPVAMTATPEPEGETEETSEDTQSQQLDSSDDWLKVEHSVTCATSDPLPVLGRSVSRESRSESFVSSTRTIDVLSTSDYRDSSLLEEALPIEQSIMSLEDSENEKPEAELVTVPASADNALASETAASLSLDESVGGEPVTHDSASACEESLATGSGESRVSLEGAQSSSETGEKPDSGRMSPYLMINKTGNVAKVTEFESPGLLYARPTNKKQDHELTPDEVAQDALEGYEEGSEGEEEERSEVTEPTEGTEPEEYEVGLSDGLTPIDPAVLGDLERRAQLIAGNLNQVMDNLRGCLQAMSACSKQSIQLYREAVDNLHTVVDANIKAMYVFMSKFEELHKSLGPLQQIASQIQEVDTKLKVLERHFRTT